MAKGFEDTNNKACIRREFDKPILDGLAKRKGRKLFYFGLTGPEMHDIQDWVDIINSPVTSAEENSHDYYDKIGRANDIGDSMGIQIRFQRGDIAITMATGRDVDKEYPQRSSLDDGYRYFDYDIINLDFDGGLGSIFTRFKAIQELLKRQSRTEHILLITFNVRSKLREGIDSALTDLRARLGTKEANEILAWYGRDRRDEAFRIKAVVPGLIAAAANHVQLDCHAYPPIIYDGKKPARLVHFVFHLTPHDKVFRGFTTQSEAEMLALPSLNVTKGILELATIQAPDFNEEPCAKSIEFLGKKTVKAIMDGYRSQTNG